MFSLAAARSADRFDPRRIISAAWACSSRRRWLGVFSSRTRCRCGTPWCCWCIHGCAGVLWQTPNQLLLYDIVGPRT